MELLQQHPEVLDLVRDETQYLLVDEFQDINPVQVGPHTMRVDSSAQFSMF